MTLVALDLGTNIDRETSLVTALEHLGEHFTLRSASSVYKTTPVGMSNQPDFYNVSLEIETDKSISEIKDIAREIEDKMGRNRSAPKFGPRNIDIDVVLYGDELDPENKVPRPNALTELFIVGPLAEMRPDGTHPETGQTWKDLNRKLMNGRSGKDAGIERHCALTDLPLGDKAKAALALR